MGKGGNKCRGKEIWRKAGKGVYTWGEVREGAERWGKVWERCRKVKENAGRYGMLEKGWGKVRKGERGG